MKLEHIIGDTLLLLDSYLDMDKYRMARAKFFLLAIRVIITEKDMITARIITISLIAFSLFLFRAILLVKVRSHQ